MFSIKNGALGAVFFKLNLVVHFFMEDGAIDSFF